MVESVRLSGHGFLLRTSSGRARSGIVHRFEPPVAYDRQIGRAKAACGLSSRRFWLWEGDASDIAQRPDQAALNGWVPCRKCYPDFDHAAYLGQLSLRGG